VKYLLNTRKMFLGVDFLWYYYPSCIAEDNLPAKKKRTAFRPAVTLSTELREVFAAFAPEDGIASRKFDSTHGFLPTAGSPSLHPESAVTITASKGNDEYAKRNFTITVTWRYCNQTHNYTDVYEHLTSSYTILLGVLREVNFTVAKSKEPGSEDVQVVESYPYHRERGEKFPPEITQELVEIGRLLAHDMNMEIEIPDAPAPTPKGRLR
jgi:hypothetical protein